MGQYYYTCPTCGANLDPGEKCSDCSENNNVETLVTPDEYDNKEKDV